MHDVTKGIGATNTFQEAGLPLNQLQVQLNTNTTKA